MIKFGTNVDLSSDLWDKHISEINKLPYWLRLDDEHNPLSQGTKMNLTRFWPLVLVGYKIYGMNTVQLYMKVLGSRTPGHQENLNMPAVNINIGPEDTEWFCTPEKYWTDICKLCKKHGKYFINFNYDSQFMNQNLPYRFRNRLLIRIVVAWSGRIRTKWYPSDEVGLSSWILEIIWIFRCTQKPGDLVFLNSGTVHWVQATGWCNNIAWNVGPFNEYQYIVSDQVQSYASQNNIKLSSSSTWFDHKSPPFDYGQSLFREFRSGFWYLFEARLILYLVMMIIMCYSARNRALWIQ